MKTVLIGLGLGLLALQPAVAGKAKEAPPLSERAAKALAGRVAGKPLSCVSMARIRSTRIIDETAIIYEASSKLWYLNRPNDGRCPALRRDRVLVTRTSIGSYCENDIVRLIDPPTPIELGGCSLGAFIPYTK